MYAYKSTHTHMRIDTQSHDMYACIRYIHIHAYTSTRACIQNTDICHTHARQTAGILLRDLLLCDTRTPRS